MDIDGINYTDKYIKEILSEVKTIAVVGASSKPDRDSYKVVESLVAHGYKVFPVNPNEKDNSILGLNFYSNLKSIQDSVDMVDIFRLSNAVMGITQEAIEINAKVIWMQLEIINHEAANLAKAAGLKVIMDRCPKIEFKKLNWTRKTN